MKIVFATPAYRPSFYSGKRGGGEISNHGLFASLANRGCRVIIVSMTPVVGKSVYRDGNIIVIEKTNGKYLKSIEILTRFFFFKSFFKRVILKTSPDVVLASTSVIKVACEVLKGSLIPVGGIVRAMENIPEYGWPVRFSDLHSVLKFLMHKLSIGWPGSNELEEVSFLVANSEFLKQKYSLYYYNKRIYVIYPSLGLPWSEAPLPKVVSKVMMVGTSASKGFLLFKEISDRFPSLEFHAVGDPSVKKGAVKSDGNLHVHGWLDDPIKFIDTIDLVVVPSQWEEPFGRISIEGLARKKFVLVSDRGGLPETVDNNDKLIVRYDDISAWEKRVKQLADNPELFEGFVFRALRSSVKYDLKFQSDNFEKVLRYEVAKGIMHV